MRLNEKETKYGSNKALYFRTNKPTQLIQNLVSLLGRPPNIATSFPNLNLCNYGRRNTHWKGMCQERLADILKLEADRHNKPSFANLMQGKNLWSLLLIAWIFLTKKMF